MNNGRPIHLMAIASKFDNIIWKLISFVQKPPIFLWCYLSAFHCDFATFLIGSDFSDSKRNNGKVIKMTSWYFRFVLGCEMDYQNNNFMMRHPGFWKYSQSAQAESGVSIKGRGIKIVLMLILLHCLIFIIHSFKIDWSSTVNQFFKLYFEYIPDWIQ